MIISSKGARDFMPFLETKEGRWGARVTFKNLRGRNYERFSVRTMIAFDLNDTSNGFWKCLCGCGASFSASTREIEESRITACESCMSADAFRPEEILIAKKRSNNFRKSEEVIFKGNDRDIFGNIKVEFRGRVFSVNRSEFVSTGKVF